MNRNVIVTPRQELEFYNGYEKETHTDELACAESHPEVSVFLAGSIEMGTAVNWQKLFAINLMSALQESKNKVDVTFYNPRRDNWNADASDQEVAWQIQWEQERLRRSDFIFMFLDSNTTSPISLLEYGEYVNSGKLILVCDNRFYRYTNLLETAKFWNKENKVIFNDMYKGMEELQDRIINKININ